ncbi:MAG: polymer-forming cytoskeletal protein [Candidatus Thermoplasmatota archaeon]
MTFDRKTLIIPDKTCFEERIIATKGDVIIGDRSLVQFGIKTDGRIFIGEHVILDGELQASNDIRIDIFSTINGNINSGGNIYLGEKVKIQGKLSVAGDLDVGDDVEINEGFEAKGWINIRSPIPMIIYIFIYLIQLLRMGKSEEIEKILQELEQQNESTIPISEFFLFIPNNSIIGTTKSQVDTNVSIGKHCKILGNYTIQGNVTIGDESVICGTIQATGSITCGKKVKAQGNLIATGEVMIDDNSYVEGKIQAESIKLSKTATVHGTLLAHHGVNFIDTKTTEKIQRFNHDVDIVDQVEKILE